MRITKVSIKNYRSIKDETILLDSYTCLVGPNGIGKSNVLRALCVFFRADASPVGTEHLVREDFHHGDVAVPVSITITFEDLSQEAKDELVDYVRHGQLIVSAVATWDEKLQKAPIAQHGSRLVMPDFKPFFAKDKDKEGAEALKQEYKKLQAQFGLPDAPNKGKMVENLRAFEAANLDKCEQVASKDQFYGFSKGENRLRKYVQFEYVPAVKDAVDEQQEEKDTVIGRLLDRAVRGSVSFSDDLLSIGAGAREKYEQMLEQKRPALKTLSDDLTKRIREWATPDTNLELRWGTAGEEPVKLASPVAHVIAGQSGFSGQLFRMGNGLQRSFLLAILQVLASAPAEGTPTLILAVEEPELYQHPPQIRHLAAVLRKLATTNAQVLVSTHAPLLVTGREFETVRLAHRVQNGPTLVAHATVAEVSKAIAVARGEEVVGVAGRTAKLHESLQPDLSEMFFCERLVLVEGASDRAYILGSLEILGKLEGFRALGAHVVPTEGKSHMIQPRAVAEQLGIPTFTVFDGDTKQAANRADKLDMHRKDNVTLLGLGGYGPLQAHPWTTLKMKRCWMWGNTIEDAIASSADPAKYPTIREKILLEFDQIPDLGKDTLYVYRLLEELNAQGAWPPVLTELCDAILTDLA